MRSINIITLALLISTSVTSQNWTWVRGSNNGGSPGNSGTMGVASATNEPAARHGCATWVDALGNLWMFGGEDALGYWYSDLWKYDPLTNQWTWMRGSNAFNSLGSYGTMGVAAATNDPPAREFAAYWTDLSGKFWMFGGTGPLSSISPTTSARYGDLWKFDPSSNEWTWMGGVSTPDQNGIYGTLGIQTSGTRPGGREGSAGWVDNNGKFWLFGGHGYPASGTQSGLLNDLWRYDPSMGLWTWMGGSNQINQTATYGTQSVPSTANIPGGRRHPAYWKDLSGNLWLFGGEGYTSTLAGRNNDLWKYNVTNNTWTWITGSNAPNPPGVYGTKGISAPANQPGGRRGSAFWIDGMGDLWLFGGGGYAKVGTGIGELNDMFRFSIATGEWTWMKGRDTISVSGIYGTMGVTTASNMPGSRIYNVFWKKNNQQFWLFGGEGFDSQGQEDNMNDLWRFGPPCSPDSIKTNPSLVLCSGQQATFTAYNQLPSSVAWYTQGVSGTAIATGSVYTSPPLTAVASPSVYSYFAEANTCTALPRTMVTITVNPQPNIQITAPSSVCEAVQFTVSASGASSYTWSTGPNASSITVTASSPSVTYIVIGSSLNCENSASVAVNVLAAPLVTLTSGAPFLCQGSTVTISASGNHSYAWNTSATGSTISVSPSVTTVYSVVATGTNGCMTNASITQSVSLCEGLSEQALAAGPLVYPNPSTGFVSINGSLAEGTTLVIMNALGQRVAEINPGKKGDMISLQLAPGLYYYEFDTKGLKHGKGRLVIE
jgi:hypothetical protein